MQTDCPICGLTYDDLYRRTSCPHENFAMHTVVVRGDGRSRVCTNIEELDAFLGEHAPCTNEHL